MTTHGSCLCGGVRFVIDVNISPIGLCHCSKCRKVTGTGATANVMTSVKSLRYLQGEDSIKQFTQPSGFESRFCGACGSPMPLPHPNGKVIWVPAGLLEGEDPALQVAMHIYVDSKAAWDVIPAGAEQYPEDWPGSQL